MTKLSVAIHRIHKDAILPEYQTHGAAAMDLHACLETSHTLQPLERAMIPLGFTMALPIGYEAQIRARSGLSIKYGITMINGIGTIDSDYRGEVGVLLVNLGQEPFVIEPGMRIAQMVIAQYEQVTWNEVDELDVTDRGMGGFGSTGS